MVFDLLKVTGIGDFTSKKEKERELFFKDDKVFLVTVNVMYYKTPQSDEKLDIKLQSLKNKK